MTVSAMEFGQFVSLAVPGVPKLLEGSWMSKLVE